LILATPDRVARSVASQLVSIRRYSFDERIQESRSLPLAEGERGGDPVGSSTSDTRASAREVDF